jgi:three-Cys-motif partner protein
MPSKRAPTKPALGSEGRVQSSFIDLTPIEEAAQPAFRPLARPIWTENKARLIERYLFFFVMLTKHGTYIDGFAGPQEPDTPGMWAAKLVLENEPRWLRNFHLFELDQRKVTQLEELKRSQPPRSKSEPKRLIEIYSGDFNTRIRTLLAARPIPEREATFCLLDQRTFECEWATVEALARYKQQGTKIELFYFLPIAWLDRAISGLTKNKELLRLWWGRDDWVIVAKARGRDRAALFCQRFRDLGYRYVTPWPIFARAEGGKTMYHMIHATDHIAAPGLMRRAYERALQPKESVRQLELELGLPSTD